MGFVTVHLPGGGITFLEMGFGVGSWRSQRCQRMTPRSHPSSALNCDQ